MGPALGFGAGLVAVGTLALVVADVQDVVRTALGGMRVTQTVEGLERYPVNLRFPREQRNDLEKLRALPLVTPTGAAILGALLAALWLSLIIWAFRDMRLRSRDPFAQLLAALIASAFISCQDL